MKYKTFTYPAGAIVLCLFVATSSCKKEEPAPPEASKVAGLWGVSESSVPATDGAYIVYFRFTLEGEMEAYSMFAEGSIYNTGTFTISNDVVNYRYRQVREFRYQNNIPRYVWHLNNDPKLYGFTIDKRTDEKIQYTNSNGTYYLHRVESLPANWNSEFSAPEVQPSAETLPGAWDYINMYQIESAGTSTYRTVKSPETDGITLLGNNGIENAQFWVNYLHAKLQKGENIPTGYDIYVSYADNQWIWENNKLTLSCSRYSIGKRNSQGQFVAEKDITPTPPVTASFSVHAMSEYYLILTAYDYAIGSLCYYAFHRHPQSAKGSERAKAPEQQNIRFNTSSSSSETADMQNVKKSPFLW